MIVFRLAKTEFAEDLSGKGAELSGGRWNHKGVPLLYTSESRALCVAEIAVHIPLGIVPTNYSLVTIEISEKINIHEIKIDSLENGWNAFPYRHSTKEFLHDKLMERKYLVIKVPSAVVQGSFNYLINPRHKYMNLIKIKFIDAFTFDQRLFR